MGLNFHKLNRKLTFYYSAIFMVILGGVLLFSYLKIKDSILEHVQETMSVQMELIKKGIETSADVSVKNYFRATAYSSLEVVNSCHQMYQQGDISLEEARKLSLDLIGHKKLGPSGYIAIINGDKIMVSHPRPEFVNKDISHVDFVDDVLNSKEIYFEYMWKNPEDKVPREKSMYSIYFEPWDWHISVTGYKSELNSLLTIDDFEEQILSTKFGETGYPVVLDQDGTLIIHPKLKGKNFVDSDQINGWIVRKAIAEKNGFTYYMWKNPGESSYRKKITLFSEIEAFGFIVAVTAYEDEFLKPLRELNTVYIVAIILAFILIVLSAQYLSNTITKPVVEIKEKMGRASGGDLTVRAEIISSDEIGEIGDYFNEFITKLEEKQKLLQDQLEVNSEINDKLKCSLTKLTEAQNKLIEEERFSNMGRLLARFSHHLNTPMGTAQMAVSIIYESYESLQHKVDNNELTAEFLSSQLSTCKDAIELIRSSISKSIELIESFKLLQIDQGSIKYNEFDAYAVILSQQNSIWQLNCPTQIKINIVGDSNSRLTNSEDLLVKFLSQLINNSIHHSFKKRGEGNITLTLSPIKGGLTIVYEDDGEGISSRLKDYIFQPFFNSGDNEFNSSGVGLNLVYHIVQNYMGGDIVYEGDKQSGIRYHITLPNKESHC